MWFCPIEVEGDWEVCEWLRALRGWNEVGVVIIGGSNLPNSVL